jgi:2-amino-4-hydroxy-6-hydroxymethyldihydropteridine diphosphokinase
MQKIFLGLGSDTGDRRENLSSAISMIEESVGRNLVCSKVYETEPWGFYSPHYFLNMVLSADTDLSCREILERIFEIEAKMGRLEKNFKYSPRIIDIDILFYGNMVFSEQSLIVPHPLLQERKFVLVPLNEIAPGLVHPLLYRSVSELLESCNDNLRVTVYKPGL